MPRNPKPLDAPRIQTTDYYGAAHLSVSKNDAVANIKILSKEMNKATDSTVLRAANLKNEKIIYFRAESKNASTPGSKNKKEIKQNRENMRQFLGDLVENFEKAKGNDISDGQRKALNTLRDLASNQGGDITVRDVKFAFEEITKTKRESKIEKIKKDHKTPKRTESQSRKLMLNRFGMIDQLQKENLKKLLFPSGSKISDQSQEQAISNMQSLVALQLKNPKASLEDLVEQCKGKEKIEKFVDAWLTFRAAEKNPHASPLKISVQFVWAETMDEICSGLKKSVFSSSDQTKDRKNQRVILVDSPISPVIRKKMATSGPVLTPQTSRTTHKKKISVVKRNSPELKPILQNKKTKVSPALFLRNAKNGSPVFTNFISSFAFKLNDAADNSPGLMRRTESGDLERQFVFYEVAAAEAKAKSVLAKMRLERLYLARTHVNNSPVSTTMTGANPSERSDVSRFTEVRDQITAASSNKPILALSPLPVGATLNTVSKSNMSSHVGLEIKSVNPIPLPLTSSEISILDEEQSTGANIAPTLIYSADQGISSSSTVNNNQL